MTDLRKPSLTIYTLYNFLCGCYSNHINVWIHIWINIKLTFGSQYPEPESRFRFGTEFIMSEKNTQKQPSLVTPAELACFGPLLPELIPFIPLLKKVPDSVFAESVRTGKKFRAEWDGSSLHVDNGIIRAISGNMLLTAAGPVLSLDQPGSRNQYSLRKMRALAGILSDRRKNILSRNLYALNCYFALTHTADRLNIRFVPRDDRTILEYYHRPSANAQGHYQWVTNDLTVSRELIWGWDDIDRFFHGDVCSVLQENGIQLDWNSTHAVFEKMSIHSNGTRIVERYIRIS